MERSNENFINLRKPPLNQGIPMDRVTKYSIETLNANRKKLGDIENLIGGPTPAAPIAKRPLQEREVKDLKNNRHVSLVQGPMTRNSAATRRMAYEKEIMGHRNELKILDDLFKVEEEEEEIIPDIDINDIDNPLAVVEYVEEIFDSYRRSEDLSCVNPSYMSYQFDIDENMRATLIDWLVKAHDNLELEDEILFLTVNLIDRFLALQTVTVKKLLLVGVTALLLACKYEEVTKLVVEDFIIMCDRVYTRPELLKMERLMTGTLQFKLSVPTPYVFMKRFLKAAQSDKTIEMLSFFILELCLVEYKMLQFKPSLLAAAAVFTAQCTLTGIQWWSKCSEVHTRYNQDQLIECSRLMVELHQKASQGNLTGVYRKFSSSNYGCVSKCEPGQFLEDDDDDDNEF